MKLKRFIGIDVLEAARRRISKTFDDFERIQISFSGGKDSSVMFHLVMEEAQRRNRKVGVLLIDFEAQYTLTMQHAEEMFDMYAEYIDLHWICLPMALRNAVSNFEPSWVCWEPGKEQDWVRPLPKHEGVISKAEELPFFEDGMEFEEFIILFADWYSQGEPLAVFVGIRADESLNRFRAVALLDKKTWKGRQWTTHVVGEAYNVYPIYDWKTSDIWAFHATYPDKPYNKTYSLMNKAGVPLSQQRLCQPYGYDQRRGLWLYHLLEPETWYKVVSRVNGVNSGALYVQETGNITGYNKITKPANHTWKSYCNLLLSTMPEATRDHYIEKFRGFIRGWKARGYTESIPDEAPKVLENKHWAPSWRRMCKVLLRNDWWCKGLGLTQPKSEAYAKYLTIKKARMAASKLEMDSDEG